MPKKWNVNKLNKEIKQAKPVKKRMWKSLLEWLSNTAPTETIPFEKICDECGKEHATHVVNGRMICNTCFAEANAW